MKETDKLEQFILDNRDEFDAYEPSADVWERILLTEEKPKVIKLNWTSILWKAAAIAVILASGVFIYLQVDKFSGSISEIAENETEVSTEKIIIPELEEAEAYYSSLVSQKMSEVKKFTASFPDIENEVRYDLTELDSICAELKADLKDNIDNEEIIDAMIQNYRLKLKILEDILSYLQDSNKNEDINETLQYEI